MYIATRLKIVPPKENNINGVRIKPEINEPSTTLIRLTIKAERKSSCHKINKTNTFANPIFKKGKGLGRKFSSVKRATASIEKAASIDILLGANFI